MTLESFSYLWDGRDEGWILVRLGHSSLPAIYNRVTRTALTIEDDEIYAQVVQNMNEHGVQVFDHLP
jgi:hypothetical protein